MEEKNIVEENTSVAIADIGTENIKNRSRKCRPVYHEKLCKVIRYNKIQKTLDIYFDTYGIRIKNVEYFHGDSVVVKYTGEIGTPNFKVSL